METTKTEKIIRTVREDQTFYGFDSRTKVTKSSDAEEFLRPFFTDIDEVESFHLLVLTRAHTIISHKLISLGGVSGTVADPKIIFRFALSVKGGAGIIVAHNHPSGNLTASQSDIDLTKKVKEGGRILDMPLLDHLILTPNNRYVSLADQGLF